MILNISKIAKSAGVKTPDLITRPIGRKVYEATEKKLLNLSDNEVIILDFERVEVIDSSFIDEFLVKLMVEPQYGNVFLKLRNISPTIEINIESVLQAYSRYNGRIAITKEDFGSKQKYYLGTLSHHEGDIMDYMRTNKSATLDEISNFLGISEDKTVKTLNELVDLKLIRIYDNRYTCI